jgi:anti-anti-sigma factor
VKAGTAWPARVLTRSDDEAVVAVAGEIDISTAPTLRACLTRCVSDGCTDITLDASEMTFMDCSGLSVLASISGQLQSRGGRLAMRNLPPMAVKLLSVSRLAACVELIDPGSEGKSRRVYPTPVRRIDCRRGQIGTRIGARREPND